MMENSNRILKFRAWDKDDKVMRNWENLMTGVYAHRGDTIFNDDDYILMQYIGLKDRNGKEIYEGDIIRILYTDWNSQCLGTEKQKKMTLNDYLKSISHIGVCVFRDGGFGIEFWKDHVNSIFEGEHGRKVVVGNIHENSEIIKEKK